jgi:guanine deaminase
MCLGAIYWARPSRVFFAATHQEAAAAGFDDSFIYQQIAVPHAQRTIPMTHIMDELRTQPFEEWGSKLDRLRY